MKFLIILQILFMTASCGIGSQTTEEKSQLIDAKQETVSDGVSASTLILDQGSAKGAQVDIGAGVLPEGSKLSLDRATESPQDFTDTNLSAASKPIVVQATDANGNSIEKLSAPMTISLPLGFGLSAFCQKGSNGACLSADPISQEDSNLCVFLKNSLGMFIWRSEELTISEQTVQAKSLYLGTFQLFYCGDEEVKIISTTAEEPTAVVEAKDAGVIDEVKNIKVTLAKTYFGPASKFCILAVDSKKVLQYKEVADVTADLSVNFEFLKSDLPEALTFYLLSQIEGQSCSFTLNADFDSLSYHQMVFVPSHKDYDPLTTDEVVVALGEGDFSLSKYTLSFQPEDVVNPESFNALAYCLRGDDSVRIQGTMTKDLLTFYLPGNSDLYLDVGVSCEEELSSSTYSFKFAKTVTDIRLIPFNFKTSGMSAFTGQDICMEVYNSTYNFGEDRTTDLLAIWPIQVSSSELQFYLPWEKGKTTDLYDILMSPGSNCNDGKNTLTNILKITEDDLAYPATVSF